MNIYLDMDGVITNFVDRFLSMDRYAVSHDDIKQWDMHRCLGITEDEMWRRINSYGEDFWSGMRKYPWADTMFKWFAERHPVVYLTSPGQCPYAASGKLKWIQKQHDRTQQWVFTSQKHLLAASGILVDDSDKNCEAFRKAGGRAILFPQPWNANRVMVHDRMGYVIETCASI